MQTQINLFREDDHLDQNNNVYTWSLILSWYINVRHFCQWILKSRHCLDIYCQLSGRVPSCVSRVKTEQSVREDDHLYQNHNVYTWPHILSWCTMQTFFQWILKSRHCLDIKWLNVNFLVGCHDVFPMWTQSNLFRKMTIWTRTIMYIHGLLYIELVHYARHFCQWILKSWHCLDIFCQISGSVPSCFL